jgi:hypothetical protein
VSLVLEPGPLMPHFTEAGAGLESRASPKNAGRVTVPGRGLAGGRTTRGDSEWPPFGRRPPEHEPKIADKLRAANSASKAPAWPAGRGAVLFPGIGEAVRLRFIFKSASPRRLLGAAASCRARDSHGRGPRPSGSQVACTVASLGGQARDAAGAAWPRDAPPRRAAFHGAAEW